MAEERMRLYSKHGWRTATATFVAYGVLYYLSGRFISPTDILLPASAVGLAGLFFGGLRIWPAVLLASLAAQLALHISIPLALYRAVVEVLQALAGAALLRQARLDPLFRRNRDTLILVVTIVIVSLVTPTLGLLWDLAHHTPLLALRWEHRYASMLFCLLMLAPFLLRWFGKLHFSRPWREVLETVAVFALLVGIVVPLYAYQYATLLNIPLAYLLLLPLGWIALRLRPRFVTLALALTAAIAVIGLRQEYAAAFAVHLYQTEAYLIAVATIFYIIVSLEEDRRLNTNLMRSQMAAMENANARIRSESNAKNDFIAVLAHELRNPLAPVVSAIDYLKLTGEEGTEQGELLDMMSGRLTTVRRLLDDLLDASKISEGTLVVKKEPVDVETVLRRALLSTAHYAKERHQAVNVRGPKEPLTVLGDPVRLEQIFSNLLTNASKYSNPGDTIEVSLTRAAGHARFAVRDHGIGIPQDSIDRIFLPFRQLGTGERSQNGLGIGLAIVRSFVEVHGGTITAESAGPGEGSTFVVQLPLASSDAPEAEHAVAVLPNDRERNRRVLIIEYNDAAAWSMGRLIELQGYQVHYAYDADTALDPDANRMFGTVLISLDLAGQAGYALAQKLRHDGYTGLLVAISSSVTDETRRKARTAGFQELLQRPPHFAELRRVLPELT